MPHFSNAIDKVCDITPAWLAFSLLQPSFCSPVYPGLSCHSQMQENQMKWSKIGLLFPQCLGTCAVINWPKRCVFLSLKSRKNIICRPSSGLCGVWGRITGRGADGSVWNFHDVLVRVRVCLMLGLENMYVQIFRHACKSEGHRRASGNFNLGFVLQNSLIYNKCTVGNRG